MTGKIFSEWLKWFSLRLEEGRNVVLLIDSFSAHKLGLSLREAIGGTPNVKVLFLPTNATSICQPLDQGIIQAWKAYYRKDWLQFAVAECMAEPERNPQTTMNVLQAVQWAISAWEGGVTSDTIARCWLKSRVLGPRYGPFTQSETEDDLHYYPMIQAMQGDINTLEQVGNICSAMQIGRFINPVEEQVDDSDIDIVDQIVGRFGVEKDVETDEDVTVTPPKTDKEALEALETLYLYEVQQEDSDCELIKLLNRRRRGIKDHMAEKKTQQPIYSYFSV